MKNLVIAGLVVALALALGGLLLGRVNAPSGAPFSRVLTPVTFSNNVTLNGEVALGANNCVATTWNPADVGTSSPDFIDVTLDSTFADGDLLVYGFSTSTLGLQLTVQASSTGVVQASLSQPDIDTAGTVNIATGTLNICYFDAP